MTDLAALLQDLPPTDDEQGNRFRVRTIPDFPRHYVGRDAKGAPCLLLRSTDLGLRAPIRLEAIDIRFAIPCLVSEAGGPDGQEPLTVVVCTVQDHQIERYFLYVCEAILRMIGANPSFGVVAEAVQRLVDLFRRLSLPPVRPLIGLIGELVVLAVSANVVTAAQAWRSNFDDRFDFSTMAVRMEVKASAVRTRAHEISQDQCSAPPGAIGVLASLFVESTGGGTSLLDLIRRIEGRLAGRDDLITKVQQTVSATLGNSLATALAARFDEGLARTSLQFYDLEAIPAIRGPAPIGVSRVRFQTDLSRVPHLDLMELGVRGAVLAGLLPT